TVTGGSGDDYVIGDHGTMVFTGTGNLTEMSTRSDELGGDDIIILGDGDNIAIGGQGNDTVTTGNGNDIVFGDFGSIILSGGLPLQAISIPSQYGGDDIISGGDGNDILIGGEGSDRLSGGNGTDILIGDNGVIQFSNGIPVKVETRHTVNGDADILNGGEDTDILIGGEGRDVVIGKTAEDILISKYGRVILEDYRIKSVYPSLYNIRGGALYRAERLTITEQGILAPPDRSLFMQTEHKAIAGGTVITGPEEAFGPFGYYSNLSDGNNPGQGESTVKTVILSDGSMEKRYPNGLVEIIKQDNTIVRYAPDGREIIIQPDGVIIITMPNGIKTIKNPNGSSVTTYPDGRVIKVLPDGTIINSSAENDGAEVRLKKLLLSARRDTDGLSDMDIDLPQGLKAKESSDSLDQMIDITSMVAGLTGWGALSGKKSETGKVIDKEGFISLDRRNRLRRFIKWTNGEQDRKREGESLYLKKKEFN
ncbi:MAG: hypothetical protein GX654_12970, partial [Desulfatiglans sp.]|nr:hypothetical protein [Desulfatiglans sp.]